MAVGHFKVSFCILGFISVLGTGLGWGPWSSRLIGSLFTILTLPPSCFILQVFRKTASRHSTKQQKYRFASTHC